MGLEFNAVDKEVIFLKAIKELIDSMVNFEVLRLVGIDPDSEVRFESITHQHYFNIILVDFLSVTDKRVPVEQKSYLNALQAIVDNPCFNSSNSIALLEKTTFEFANWLKQKVEVKVWLPSIDTETALKFTRENFLKMSGNISKHNLLKLGGVANDLIRILSANDIYIGVDDALLALADFYEKFHFDVFSYHSSTLAEFLNNIRWGIYEYLRPEYCQSIVSEPDSMMYRYTYPREMTSEFAKTCYWNLMNEVRNAPYMPRFHVTQNLKQRY